MSVNGSDPKCEWLFIVILCYRLCYRFKYNELEQSPAKPLAWTIARTKVKNLKHIDKDLKITSIEQTKITNKKQSIIIVKQIKVIKLDPNKKASIINCPPQWTPTNIS